VPDVQVLEQRVERGVALCPVEVVARLEDRKDVVFDRQLAEDRTLPAAGSRRRALRDDTSAAA
jgi:hypothetical protein